MGCFTEDVPSDVISINVDVPGADATASCGISFCFEFRMHCRTDFCTIGFAAAMQV